MDRLPTEILAKVCAYAGVGYFPALRCVSRGFNRACDVVSHQYAAEHGYPASLDYYSTTDLARLGHTELLNGQTASVAAFQAAFENGQLQAAIYLDSKLQFPFAMHMKVARTSEMFRRATANGHMDVVCWGVQEVHKLRIADLPRPVFVAIVQGLVRRRAPASDLTPFEYLVSQEPAAIDYARCLLSYVTARLENIPLYELFIDYVKGGCIEIARAIYPQIYYMSVGDIVSAAIDSSNPGMLAWALDLVGDRFISWGGRMEAATMEAHIYVIRATARHPRSPYKPASALLIGLPVYLALIDCHPDMDVAGNRSIALCRSAESVRYCVARGADISTGEFEFALMQADIHTAFAVGQQLSRASRLLVLYRVARNEVFTVWSRRTAKCLLRVAESEYPDTVY